MCGKHIQKKNLAKQNIIARDEWNFLMNTTLIEKRNLGHTKPLCKLRATSVSSFVPETGVSELLGFEVEMSKQKFRFLNQHYHFEIEFKFLKG